MGRQDQVFMSQAIQCALAGLYSTDPNPRVGCVIVRDGQCIATGTHWRAGERHAEIEALHIARERGRGATAYVTLEPCAHFGRTPPCADALIEAGIRRVVIGMVDPDPRVSGQGIARLRSAGMEVRTGILEEECRALNPGFLSRMERGRPFVRVKLASSLDGRTALVSGESNWITGVAARTDVQHWRARAGAILTGSGTIVHDDPRLNVRMTIGELLHSKGFSRGRIAERMMQWIRQPARVIVDSQLRIPEDATLFREEGPVWIYTNAVHFIESPERIEVLTQRGAEIIGLPANPEGRIQLLSLMEQLAQRGINEVHVEAGAGLAGALLNADLVDEWVFYLAPSLLGAKGKPLVDCTIHQLSDRLSLRFLSVVSVGEDLRIVARPSSASPQGGLV